MDDAHSLIKVNAPTVVFEIVQDEAIIINFETGVYHSLRGVGLSAWQCIANTTTRAGLLASITSMYDAEPDDIQASMTELLEELVAADLVALKPDGIPLEPSAGSHPGNTALSVNERRPFAPPVLETYGDMQDYLLMDPIHEVDASGWPHSLPTADDG